MDHKTSPQLVLLPSGTAGYNLFLIEGAKSSSVLLTDSAAQLVEPKPALPPGFQRKSWDFLENTLLAIEREFQARTDWHKRRPPGIECVGGGRA